MTAKARTERSSMSPQCASSSDTVREIKYQILHFMAAVVDVSKAIAAALVGGYTVYACFPHERHLCRARAPTRARFFFASRRRPRSYWPPLPTPTVAPCAARHAGKSSLSTVNPSAVLTLKGKRCVTAPPEPPPSKREFVTLFSGDHPPLLLQQNSRSRTRFSHACSAGRVMSGLRRFAPRPRIAVR